MKIKDLFAAGRQTLSFEMFPPKKDTPEQTVLQTVDRLCALKPDYISVTYGAGGSDAGDSTLSLCSKIIKGHGALTLPHLTCLSSSKAEIEEFIKRVRSLGIENVFALRGDVNPNAPAKNEFGYAYELIELLKPYGFGITGACYPEGHSQAPSLEADLLHCKQKVDCGAEHLISQLFFDNDIFLRFLDKARSIGINVPIEAGIMPVTSKSKIEKMVTLCGASIPSGLSRLLSRYENDPVSLFDAAVDYSVRQIDGLLSAGVDGIHLYTMNNASVASLITEQIRSHYE